MFCYLSRKSISIVAYIVVFGFLSSATVFAEPAISAECGGCIYSDGVLSVPLGTAVTLQAADASAAIEYVIWDLGDGNTANGLAVRHGFKTPGKFTVKALAIYPQLITSQATLTVHVVAAPAASNDKLFGLPSNIVIPIISALATALLYYLSGYTGGI